MIALRVLVAMVVVAAAGFALHRFAWEPLRCAHAESMGQIVLEDAELLRVGKRRELARRVLADLRDCDCASVTRADAARMNGDAAAAIEEYERALRLDRRPSTYFRLGHAQLDAFDRAGAIESFTRACVYHPALLERIPYDDVRDEVRRAVVARYGEAWLP